MPINNISPAEIDELFNLFVQRLQEKPDLLLPAVRAAITFAELEENEPPEKPKVKRGRPRRK